MARRMNTGNNRPTHEEITQRAKAIYEASGGVPGRDLENWLAAEAELLQARTSASNGATLSEPRPVYKEMLKPSNRH